MTGSIERAEPIPFRLPLRKPWRFGDHRITERRGWLVRVTDTNGVIGWGEAAPFPEAGTESPRRAKEWLEAALAGLAGMTPDRALGNLPPASKAPPAARCGVETALLDLAARNAGLPLARFLAADAAESIAVNAALGTLGSTEPEDLDAAIAAGFRCLKLKVGVDSPEQELARLEQLLERLPDGVELRLDANRAWSREQAEHLLSGLQGKPVNLVEEPLREPDLAALAALRSASPVPLALDESLDHANLDAVLAAAAADLLVVKPMRLGGLLPCLEIARRARAVGVATLVTTTLDGAPATHGAAHLAAAIEAGGANLAHGLATGGWLAWDLAPGLVVKRGRITLPRVPGLGCTPYPDGAHRT